VVPPSRQFEEKKPIARVSRLRDRQMAVSFPKRSTFLITPALEVLLACVASLPETD
jgi:hypothetical protein